MTGTQLIAQERSTHPARGWSKEHDRDHQDQLVDAALCYLAVAKHQVDGTYVPEDHPRVEWPWSDRYWAPSDPIRNLVKAGSLIAAAIDALDDAKIRGEVSVALSRIRKQATELLIAEATLEARDDK